MKKVWVFFLVLILPFIFVGCENKNKNTLSTPKNLTVSSDGQIIFERVDNDQYYVINIDGYEFNVFIDYNENVTLFTKDDVKYVQYDASNFFDLGEDYNVKVKAKADKKRDSSYSDSFAYTHTTTLQAPTNIKISNTTLTWDAIENADSYKIKLVSPDDQKEREVAELYTNRFEFSPVLSYAGKYKFYVCSSSLNSNYKSSDFVSVDYDYKIQLETPQQNYVYKSIDGDLNLVTIIDENSNFITIEIDGVKKTNEINSVYTFIKNDYNVLNINLNKYFKDEINAGMLDLTMPKQYNIKISTSKNILDETKYYLDSNTCEDIVYDNIIKLDQPQASLIFNNQIGKYLLTWDSVSNAVGYTVVFNSNGNKVSHDLGVNEQSLMIDNQVEYAYVIANGQGNFINSDACNVVSSNSTELQNISVEVQGNMLTWTNISGATYILEIDNQIKELTTNSFDLLSLENNAKYIKLTALKDSYKPKTIEKFIDYTTKLSTPRILGFGSQYVLNFDAVSGAIGYKIYLTDKNNNQTAINKIFTTNSVDISKFIIKQGLYGTYTVDIQAIAGEGLGYSNSTISNQKVQIVHTQQLAKPEFSDDFITKDENGNYYLNFNAVVGANRYEIIINHNVKSVNDNGQESYSVDITDYMQTANLYAITLRALPEENSGVIASENSKEYTLYKKLNKVTNVNVVDNNGNYILNFDRQDNATSYVVTIIKHNDGEYNSYLTSQGLENNFIVFGSIDITKYVSQAGEYNIYVTALPKDYYTKSDISEEYGVVNKLTSLNTPFGQGINNSFVINNQASDKLFVEWVGDEHADYYIVKVTNPKQKSQEFKTSGNVEELNISSFFTIEGDYKISIKAMVNATGENSILYTSSSYSEQVYYTYNYTLKHDFERYHISYNGEVFNFNIKSYQDLVNNLWRYYLFNDYERLSLYIDHTTDESLTDAILSLADGVEQSKMYNFSLDETWQEMVSIQGAEAKSLKATDLELFTYLVNVVLEKYPELAVLQDLRVEQQGNSFRLKYNNVLDDQDYETNDLITMATDYANKFSYLNDFERRGEQTYFAIDGLNSLDVYTTEQLLQAVQYGYKPNFATSGLVAETVYLNAKDVLKAIISKNMTDVEKSTRIFDWLSYAYNINTTANCEKVGDHVENVEVDKYGLRQEYYLEGIFLNINNSSNGGFDGEFYLGNGNATSDAFAKAFTLMCAIEGIETRKVVAENTSGDVHSFNKIKLDIFGTGAVWYAVDIKNSDYYSNFNLATHLYFLIDEAKLCTDLQLTEYDYLPNIKAESSYDYYANNSFGLTKDQILKTLNQNGDNNNLGAYADSSIEYGKLFDNAMEYRETLRTEDYSAIENYVFSWLVYAKYYLCFENEGNVSNIEFATNSNFEAIGSSTINKMINIINTYFVSSNQSHITRQEIELKSFSSKLVGDKIVYVITLGL